MKDFQQVLRDITPSTDIFPGVVVFGNSMSSSNTTVAVYLKGAILNDMTPTRRLWPTDEVNPITGQHFWDTHDVEGRIEYGTSMQTPEGLPVRIHLIEPESVIFMSKDEIKKQMGIKNLHSQQGGFRGFKNTLIGDVLYLTMEDNYSQWSASVSAGYIDKRHRINKDKLVS
jgi:hypothetical protein